MGWVGERKACRGPMPVVDSLRQLEASVDDRIAPYRRYDLREVAEIKGVSLKTVRRWVEEGLLPAINVGSQQLVRGADLFLVGKVADHGGHVVVDLGSSQLNAPGNDNDNLNQQFICLQNHTRMPVVLSGWHLQDAKGATYTFPHVELPVDGCVRVHTGSGRDTATDLYWGRRSSVWCNEGDTISLYDRLWGVVDRKLYEPTLD